MKLLNATQTKCFMHNTSFMHTLFCIESSSSWCEIINRIKSFKLDYGNNFKVKSFLMSIQVSFFKFFFLANNLLSLGKGQIDDFSCWGNLIIALDLQSPQVLPFLETLKSLFFNNDPAFHGYLYIEKGK